MADSAKPDGAAPAPSPEPSAPTKPTKPPKNSSSHLTIRSYPSVVFLYPTFIASIVCGLWVTLGDVTTADPGVSGLLFTILFFFNLSILAFDYTRLVSIIIALLVVIALMASAIWPQVGQFFKDTLDQPLFMNATFYWVWTIGMTIMFIVAFIKAHIDYWEVKNNELLHHHGILGDVERWPAPNMRITKEINDVLEYALMRSGRLVLIPSREARALVIPNVPFINRVEAKMQHLLSRLRVSDED